MSARTKQLPPKTRLEDLAGKAAAFAVLITAFAFAYLFFEVVVVVACAILVAAWLSLFASPLCTRLNMHRWAAVMVATLVLASALGGAAYLFGTRFITDIQDVIARMSAAQNSIRADLQGTTFGKMIVSHLGTANIPLAEIARGVFSTSTSILAGAAVAFVAGLYLAAQPSVYLDGFLLLFPEEKRSSVAETAEAVTNGLYRWLEGQLISMLLVGILSALAAWLIGLPSALALGLIAGIAEFIPYAGPVIASIPALLVAATQSPDAIIWTLAAYVAIHLTEGNIIAPLVSQEMVYVPPALMLLGIAAIGIVFGTVAILFAAPTVVVIFVLVKKLYVREMLGEEITLPGEE